ncbi:MAG: RraA family protein [Cyanobacteria bacterium SZAS-4]|nr:RraA family protein [Cyanobacteria bacterium SZAS-4]
MTTTTQTDNAIATAQIVDACMRLKLPYRIAPAGIRPIANVNSMITGPAIPVRHYGSVDIFLETIETTEIQNGILVIDNKGREDEACIGDLVVLEAKLAGIKAIVVWGLHRDTSDLIQIGLPVFSYGAYPAGPARLDSREPDALTSAHFRDFFVTKSDTAFLDADGVVFVETNHVQQILGVAQTIKSKERHQAESAAEGKSLRAQFQFQDYLKQREKDANYTFRMHLSALAKSIEE